jgi:uncharacterized protein YndB with AHSA1/START domain
MDYLYYTGLALFLLIVVVLAIAATKPNIFRIDRSITITSPPEPIFAILSDFHQSEAWSPWEKMDLSMTKTHSGSARGVGAIYEWDGNNKVGKGRQEILEATSPSKVLIQLDFYRPFQAHNTAEFTLTSQGNTTHVHWAMFGPQPFLGKVMCLFMNMDKMVGKDFETGLANLKAHVESSR